jgi:hypothetical protein
MTRVPERVLNLWVKTIRTVTISNPHFIPSHFPLAWKTKPVCVMILMTHAGASKRSEFLSSRQRNQPEVNESFKSISAIKAPEIVHLLLCFGIPVCKFGHCPVQLDAGLGDHCRYPRDALTTISIRKRAFHQAQWHLQSSKAILGQR